MQVAQGLADRPPAAAGVASGRWGMPLGEFVVDGAERVEHVDARADDVGPEFEPVEVVTLTDQLAAKAVGEVLGDGHRRTIIRAGGR